MKIVIVSYGHVDPVLPLFKRLNKLADIDLILVFTQWSKRESLLSFTDVQVNDGFITAEKTKEILSRIGLQEFYPKIRIFVYHNNRIRSFKNTLLYFKIRRELMKYDIIHFNGLHITLFPLYYLLPGKIKKVFTMHDYKPHTGEGGKYSIFGCYKKNKLLLKTKWPVVVQNKTDFEIVQNENPHALHKTYFIPFGLFENYLYWYKPENNKDLFDVLFFGRISDYKGIQYLLEAILILQKENQKFSLCIAGSGDIDKYEIFIYKLKYLTIINEYIGSDKLVKLIQQSKIVVCPYTDATQSGVAMTAFAIGKPVIASSVGGFSEIIKDGENGFLVPPCNSQKLAEKINYLLSDNKLRKEMQKNISKLSDSMEYGWERIADKYNKLYQSL